MHYGDGRELDRFEIAMEATGLAWWWMELPSGALYCSPNKPIMLGYDPKDFIHYKHFTDLVHPDDYEGMMQDMRDHLAGKVPMYQTRYRIKAADGTYKTFFDRGKVVGKRAGQTLIAGFVFDSQEFGALASQSG